MIHRYADPLRVTDAVKREFAAAAERIIDDGGAGFGEMASLHISAAPGHPYEFVPADHPLFRVLAAVAMNAHPNLFVSLRIVGAQAPMLNKALSGGGLDHEWKELVSRHADRFVIPTSRARSAARTRCGSTSSRRDSKLASAGMT